METMRFREQKKKSYKLQIFGIVLFLLIGAGIIYFAISNEDEPTLVGNSQSNIKKLADAEDKNALVELPSEKTSDLYNITDKVFSDKTNKKIKANVTLPVISVNDQLLSEINDGIYKKFNDTFLAFKDTMSNAQNNFTYTVTYKTYDDIVANKNILSITIYERIIDDGNKKNSMEKIHSYNIDLKSSKVLEQNDVVIDILGSTYKDKIKECLEEYVINNKMVNKDEYKYSYTSLEAYYIKDNEFHLVFNPGEIVDKKHGILDIVMK